MNFTLVISTRFHESSPAGSTQIVPESTLCHSLESFDIVHVLTEAFLGVPFKCPDSPFMTQAALRLSAAAWGRRYGGVGAAWGRRGGGV